MSKSICFMLGPVAMTEHPGLALLCVLNADNSVILHPARRTEVDYFGWSALGVTHTSRSPRSASVAVNSISCLKYSRRGDPQVRS